MAEGYRPHRVTTLFGAVTVRPATSPMGFAQRTTDQTLRQSVLLYQFIPAGPQTACFGGFGCKSFHLSAPLHSDIGSDGPFGKNGNLPRPVIVAEIHLKPPAQVERNSCKNAKTAKTQSLATNGQRAM
jgi:hypothetical protein